MGGRKEGGGGALSLVVDRGNGKRGAFTRIKVLVRFPAR